jgi:hypothetical protein
MNIYPTELVSLLISHSFLSASDGSVKFTTHASFGWLSSLPPTLPLDGASAYQMANVLQPVPDWSLASNPLHTVQKGMACCPFFTFFSACSNIATPSKPLTVSLRVIICP